MSGAGIAIQSTAGAIPVKNEKGELSMQKVKVHRYVSGKRPEYAPSSSSEDQSDAEDFLDKNIVKGSQHASYKVSVHCVEPADEARDSRLRRLTLGAQPDDRDKESKIDARRKIHSPELIEVQEDGHEQEDGKSDSEEDLSEGELDRRRQALREKILSQKEVEAVEFFIKEEENKSPVESEEESSEYDESSEAEEEEEQTRLKPVFVRKKDRVTIIERERQKLKSKQREAELKKLAEERRAQSLRMIQDDVNSRRVAENASVTFTASFHTVDTEDENDEEEYEAWKLRELKRMKRDKEEREQAEKERMEIERLRTMSAEERRQEQRLNPKIVTNKSIKGKYKFLQKYFHRGSFFMDEEHDLFKRDFSAATLEDHFDKTILPKVMQVKNFGRSGRTKYTHLVDQDTTHFDSPWISESSQNLKFHSTQAAAVKQVFSKPTQCKRKLV